MGWGGIQLSGRDSYETGELPLFTPSDWEKRRQIMGPPKGDASGFGECIRNVLLFTVWRRTGSSGPVNGAPDLS